MAILAGAAVCMNAGRALAAFERHVESVRACGMGGAGLAFGADAWGGLMNPAGLAGMKGTVIAVASAPSPFGLSELSRTACALSGPLGRFAASVSAEAYGYELYREFTLSAALALDCGGGIRAGGSVTLNSLSIAGYGSARCAGCDVGMILEIVRGLEVGACVFDANAPSPGISRESIPRTIEAGLAFRAADGFLVACDAVGDPRFPAEIRLGAELVLGGVFSLRGGVSTYPSAFSAGAGIRLGPADIEYAFCAHQELGFTHHVGLSVHLGGT